MHAQVFRGEQAETFHQILAVVTDHTGAVVSASDPEVTDFSTFFRSAAKPFQAIPFMHTSGYTQEMLAIVCGSHSGTPYHTELVTRMLALAGLDESHLQCSRCANGTPGKIPPIRHNCSGKHTGMLLACVHQGLPLDSYLEATHPLQQQILAIVRQLAGFSETQAIPLALDGCGVPTFYLSLTAMAFLYARLVSQPEFQPLVQAMAAYPMAVAGEGRLDTLLMATTQGRLISKVGADGLVCVAYPDKKLALALKIMDGSAAVREPVLIHYIRQLGWLTEAEYQALSQYPLLQMARYNSQKKVCGVIQIVD